MPTHPRKDDNSRKWTLKNYCLSYVKRIYCEMITESRYSEVICTQGHYNGHNLTTDYLPFLPVGYFHQQQKYRWGSLTEKMRTKAIVTRCKEYVLNA
jgi:hypothetical protein